MGRYTFVLFSIFLLEMITVVTNNTSFVYFAPSPSMITFCSIVVQYYNQDMDVVRSVALNSDFSSFT